MHISTAGNLEQGPLFHLGHAEAIAAHHGCAENHGQGIGQVLAGNVWC